MFDSGPSPWVEVLSGLGEKGPACIRVWTGREVWLLDVGAGPEATSPFRPAWLAGAHRVFITHDHVDHIGGADEVIAAGLPIHCTAPTARALGPGADVRLLPENGRTSVDDIIVRTGRNGHALGGVWLHLDCGDGLFYSGDWSQESDWFAFNSPPPAATALIDASYGLDGITQEARRMALDGLLANRHQQFLFPVPPSGRAGELALHLKGHGDVSLDDTCRTALRQALNSKSLGVEAWAIAPLLDSPFDPDASFLICDTPNADGGMAQQIVQNWRLRGRLGHEGRVVFTGHMTAPARVIAAEGGTFLRWNVHPPHGDQIAMVRHLGARCFAPLFCSNPEDYMLETGFDAALVLNERTVL
jgi:hypothetical protein